MYDLQAMCLQYTGVHPRGWKTPPFKRTWQLVDTYDTREQALDALKLYQEHYPKWELRVRKHAGVFR